MRPNPIRRQGHEMQRQARLVSQTPADNSPPGNDAAHAGDGTNFVRRSLDMSTTGLVVTTIGPNGTQRHTVPAVASDTVALLAAAQTLANKTLTSPVLTTPQINDTSADHQYVFAVSELAADRTVTLPLLTGNDTFVFADHSQTLSNKSLKAGTGSATCKPGGVLAASSTAVGNAGTGEDDLISSTIAAAVLGTNLDHLEVLAWGTFAANANNKRVKLKFGATTLIDSGAVAINDDTWVIRATIVRTGAATQIATATIQTGDALLVSSAAYSTPTETLSGTVALKCTGEATDNDDVVQRGLLVRWHPAA